MLKKWLIKRYAHKLKRERPDLSHEERVMLQKAYAKKIFKYQVVCFFFLIGILVVILLLGLPDWMSEVVNAELFENRYGESRSLSDIIDKILGG